MSLRIVAGRFLIRAGKLLESLPVAILPPGSLVEFSRRSYARAHIIAAWSDPAVVDGGLNILETPLLEKLPFRQGRALVLGLGGGREAVALARMGFEVTGLDFIPEMVARAKENAARLGVRIEGRVQELSRLDFPPDSVDLVWLCAAMYSCVPGRRRRITFLERVARALRPGGYFICQLHYDPRLALSRANVTARRVVAALTFGNRDYENGDILWGNTEFIHAFLSEDEARGEFSAGGFSIEHLDIPSPNKGVRGGAVLRKPGISPGANR